MFISKTEYREMKCKLETMEYTAKALKNHLEEEHAKAEELAAKLEDMRNQYNHLRDFERGQNQELLDLKGVLARMKEDLDKIRAERDSWKRAALDSWPEEPEWADLPPKEQSLLAGIKTREAAAHQLKEALDGAVADTTYWRHQFEDANKRAQELNAKLAEKEAENKKLKMDLEGVRVYELQRVFALDRKVMPPCCRF